MSESVLLALDLLLVVYCCFVVFKVSKKKEVKSSDLGLFSYKEEAKAIKK